jgi:hypothetical protein
MIYNFTGRVTIALLFLLSNTPQAAGLPKMNLMGVFDSGQPSSVIIKLYDDNEDIFCYVLMPENAVKRQVNGVWTYDGNNIGSISCVAPNRKQINFDLKRK